MTRNFIKLENTTENENKYHDLRSRSQRKDGNVSKTFAFAPHHCF